MSEEVVGDLCSVEIHFVEVGFKGEVVAGSVGKFGDVGGQEGCWLEDIIGVGVFGGCE